MKDLINGKNLKIDPFVREFTIKDFKILKTIIKKYDQVKI